jgi:hypothetical protein
VVYRQPRKAYCLRDKLDALPQFLERLWLKFLAKKVKLFAIGKQSY